MRVNKYRLEKMVKVTDNWYPCIDGNKIRISMTIMYSRSKIINHHHVIIIAVGDDDYGLELCYKNKHFRKLLSKSDFFI